MTPEEILAAIRSLSPEQQAAIARQLPRALHPLEVLWNTSADVILTAIHRSTDLTQRGVRGIITELEFNNRVVSKLTGWSAAELFGDTPVDFSLSDGNGTVTVQVKMQRKALGKPVIANEQKKSWPSDKYIVEVQKTRGGEKDGEKTRPYRFGDFDIIAVSLQPATEDWSKFVYTVGKWLIPREAEPTHIQVYQPVSPIIDEYWTDDFLTCVQWLRSGEKKTLNYTIPIPPRVKKAK